MATPTTPAPTQSPVDTPAGRRPPSRWKSAPIGDRPRASESTSADAAIGEEAAERGDERRDAAFGDEQAVPQADDAGDGERAEAGDRTPAGDDRSAAWRRRRR